MSRGQRSVRGLSCDKRNNRKCEVARDIADINDQSEREAQCLAGEGARGNRREWEGVGGMTNRRDC